MAWTKFGDEFPDLARDLTDAEYRTHTEALMWSNRRLLDLRIPKRDLRRFAESPDPEAAVKGLLAKGWWEDLGDCWDVGLVRPEWQLEAAVVEHRRANNALRQQRHRMHEAGDHSICLAENCPMVTRDVTRDITSDPGRVGTGYVQGGLPKEEGSQDPWAAGPGNGSGNRPVRLRPVRTDR